MDIVGREVRCKNCGKRKSPIGRSIAPIMAASYCRPPYPGEEICPGYDEEPYSGWLFQNEKWSESFGDIDIPMPQPSDCYMLVDEEELKDD